MGLQTGFYLSMWLAFIKLPFCEPTPVRLVNGPSNCSGRVEVFYNNVWGSVCDDFWDSKNAQVVCRQLACGVALAGPGNALYGQSDGPIWMDNVLCHGNESSLSMCVHNGWGNHNCQHNEDASAICSEYLPKPAISMVVLLNRTLQLKCTVPKLTLDLMVYVINARINQTLGKSLLRNPQSFANFHHRVTESPGATVYSCQYEVTLRNNETFKSPLSDPLCVVHTDNGSYVTDISQNTLLCTNSAVTTMWSTISTTTVSGAAENGPVTNNTTDDVIPLDLGTVGENPAGPPGILPAIYSQPHNAKTVIVTSVVVPFAAVFLASLIIFIACRRKRNSLLQTPTIKENDYTDCNQHSTPPKKWKDTKLQPEPPYMNQPPIYESIAARNGGKYENKIFFVGDANIYASLNEATKIKDIYEVLH